VFFLNSSEDMKTPKLPPNNLVVKRREKKNPPKLYKKLPQISAKRNYNYKLLRIILWGDDKINIRHYQQLNFYVGY